MKTKLGLLVSVLSLVSVSSAFATQAEECKHRILFLPVLQAGEGTESTAQELDAATKVQFDIAQYLSKHRDLPVFSERASSDLTMAGANADFQADAKSLQQQFPRGLPEKFELLTKKQKTELLEAGGETASLILGNTPLIRRTFENEAIAKAHSEKIDKWIEKNPNAQEPSPEIESLMYEKREKMALEQINKFFAAKPTQKDIVLTFSIDHREGFQMQEDLFPARCIVTPFEFQSVKMPGEEAEVQMSTQPRASVQPRSVR